MPETNPVNPKRLILARESRGATQQELVALVPNLNQGNYSKIEKGLLNLPYETLVKIASILDYPVAFFYKDVVQTPISSFYYRRRISMPKKELSILEAKLDIIRILIDELLDSIDIPEFDLPQYQISDDLRPSEIAVRLRDYLGLPAGPINNLVKVLESKGVIVYFIKIDVDKFDGITLLTDKGCPIIFINKSLPNDRKRFTIAHELLHLISHIPFGALSAERDEEKEANEFASEFLMPYLECRYDLQDLKYSQLAILKSYWKLSKAAITYRAHELGAISSEKYRYLNIELSRRGERKRESDVIEIDEPSILGLIVSVYENQLSYSLNDLLSLLSLNPRDYFEYFNCSRYKVEVSPKRVIELPINKTA